MTAEEYDIELDIDPAYDSEDTGWAYDSEYCCAERCAEGQCRKEKEKKPSKEKMLDTICNTENTYVTPENMKKYIDYCDRGDIANEMEFTIYGLQAELNRLSDLLFKYTQHKE
tara:strand:+ start:2107 stop:2445 length:339 start_codon:yes stop_codon:yes gene_type:complete